MNRDRALINIYTNNYLTQMSRLQDVLAWFALKDRIVNKVLGKYLSGDFVDNESRRLFERYNVCNQILLNEELIFDDETVHRMLELCPNDNWRITLELLFDHFEPNNPFSNLELLKELQEETFQRFRICPGFLRFHEEVRLRTDRILRLFERVYDETHDFAI